MDNLSIVCNGNRNMKNSLIIQVRECKELYSFHPLNGVQVLFSGGGSQAKETTRDLVVASKGSVFGDVWVKVEQRILGNVFLGFQTVEVNNVWQTHERQLLLGVGLHWMHLGLYRGATYRKKSK